MSTATDLAAKFADLAAGARSDCTNRRRYLAERIADDPNVDALYLAQRANSLAFSEGAARVYSALTAVVNYGIRVEATFAEVIAELNQEVLSMLTASPEDEWSGRTNDVRRSGTDGARRALENAARIIRAAQ